MNRLVGQLRACPRLAAALLVGAVSALPMPGA